MINRVSGVVLEYIERAVTPLVVFILSKVEVAIVFPPLSLAIPESIFVELTRIVLKA
jgi:hypothetical protein